MRGIIRNRKKKGFTLIEIVALIAIIGILSAILIPKISNYIRDGKKIAVIDQARKVVEAYGTAKMKGTSKEIDLEIGVWSIEDSTILNLLDVTKENGKKLEEVLNKLNKNITIQQCIDIVENGQEFNVDKNGILIELTQ